VCTQSPHILQLCMGPSYFWRGLTPPDPPLFRTLDQSINRSINRSTEQTIASEVHFRQNDPRKTRRQRKTTDHSGDNVAPFCIFLELGGQIDSRKSFRSLSRSSRRMGCFVRYRNIQKSDLVAGFTLPLALKLSYVYRIWLFCHNVTEGRLLDKNAALGAPFKERVVLKI